MGAAVVTYTVLAPTSLNASATQRTSWVPCRGAVAVAFRWRTTANFAAASQTCETQNTTPLATSANGFSAASSGLTSTTGATAFDIAGGLKQLVTPTAPGRYIVQEGIRGVLVNGAGGTLANLECLAEVFYDDASLAPTGAVAVA